MGPAEMTGAARTSVAVLAGLIMMPLVILVGFWADHRYGSIEADATSVASPVSQPGQPERRAETKPH